MVGIATLLAGRLGLAIFFLVGPAGTFGAAVVVQDNLDSVFNSELFSELLACV